MKLLDSEESRDSGKKVLEDAKKVVQERLTVLTDHTDSEHDDVEKLAHYITAQIILGKCPDALEAETNFFASLLRIRDLEAQLKAKG